jgi:uncharacterized protein (TIGR02757 family)
MTPKRLFPTRDVLEALYVKFNRKSFIHPDPLEFIYHYEHRLDREIAGLIASSLAYGRVAQILKSVETVLKVLGSSPRACLISASESALSRSLEDFRHRFTSGDEMASFLVQISRVIKEYGSLRDCFASSAKSADGTLMPALTGFVDDLRRDSPVALTSLLPSPAAGSACKRLHLFLRWMIRHDEVDPGCWEGFSPSRLIIPLDTHMFSICSALSATALKSPCCRAAIEITACFAAIAPEDPVRYDFALTRLGIRKDQSRGEFLNACKDSGIVACIDES